MRNTLLVSVLIAASIISRAYGDDTDDKIRRLEARITQLEQRLAALEEEKKTTDKTVKQSSSSAEKWRDKQTWRQLKIGMTKAEVTAILGEPPKINASNIGDTWLYPDGLGGLGSVSFRNRETVNSWNEP
jgi:outer membrane murein-binding lipoprotein Lpp